MTLSDYPPLQWRNLSRTFEAGVPMKALRDRVNRLRFGPEAPLSDECLFVPADAEERHYVPGPDAPLFRRRDSGRVVAGDWDLQVRESPGNIKYIACLAHFRDGVPWEETGIYDHMMERIAEDGSFDGCRTLDDVRARYRRLDALAEEVRRTGRMKTRRELGGSYFRREHGGVLVHIGRDGVAIRAGGGQHRFALARALELPEMPVQLGVIHPEAVRSGALRHLRRSRHVDAGRS